MYINNPESQGPTAFLYNLDNFKHEIIWNSIEEEKYIVVVRVVLNTSKLIISSVNIVLRHRLCHDLEIDK